MNFDKALDAATGLLQFTLSVVTAALGYVLALWLAEPEVRHSWGICLAASVVLLVSIGCAGVAFARVPKLVQEPEAKRTIKDPTLNGASLFHLITGAIGIALVAITVWVAVSPPHIEVGTAAEAVARVLGRVGHPGDIANVTVTQFKSADAHSDEVTWEVRLVPKLRTSRSHSSTATSAPGYDFFVDSESGNVTCEIGAGGCSDGKLKRPTD